MPASPIDNVEKATGTYLATQFESLKKTSTSTQQTTLNNIVNTAVNEKETIMTDIFNNLESSSNAYKNGAFYKQRNDELAELQDAVVARTNAEKDAYDQDAHNAKRQFQVNEWSAYNKLDTLFITQLLFISLVFLAPLVYLKTRFLIPSNVFYGILLIIVLIFIFTLVWRVQYTDKSRSNLFWHRRRFGEYSQIPSTTCTS
jgi:hypothetical protein